MVGGKVFWRKLVDVVGRKWARERETSGIARVGEWANAHGCPEGKYMHYIPGKCIVCQG